MLGEGGRALGNRICSLIGILVLNGLLKIRADENRAWIKTAPIITARKAPPFKNKQIAAQIVKAYYTIVEIN